MLEKDSHFHATAQRKRNKIMPKIYRKAKDALNPE
jgi:hypothetical protein